MHDYILHLKGRKPIVQVKAYGFTRKEGRHYFHKAPEKSDFDYFFADDAIEGFDVFTPTSPFGSGGTFAERSS